MIASTAVFNSVLSQNFNLFTRIGYLFIFYLGYLLSTLQMDVRNDSKVSKKASKRKDHEPICPKNSIISKYELNDNSTHRIVKFLQKGNIELGTRVSLLSDKSLKRKKTNFVSYQQLFHINNLEPARKENTLTEKTHSATGARFLQRSSSTSVGRKRDICSKSLLVEVWVLYIVESIGHLGCVWFCSIEPTHCTAIE